VLSGPAGHKRRAEWAETASSNVAKRLQLSARMTRFDRFWEPLCFLIAVAIVWFGTL